MKTNELIPTSVLAVILKLLSDKDHTMVFDTLSYPSADIADIPTFLGIISYKFGFIECNTENNSYIVSISGKSNVDIAQKKLTTYVNHLIKNELESNMYYNKNWNVQLSEFSKTIPDDVNPKDFHISGEKYAPVILYGYLTKLINIKDISIKYYEREYPTGNPIIDTMDINALRIISWVEEYDTECINENCFNVEYRLGISEFIKKYKKGKSKEKEKYTSAQNKLLELIETRKSLPKIERYISAEDIEDICNLKGTRRRVQRNRSACVARLNKKYIKEHGHKILGTCKKERYEIIQ